MRVAPKLNGSVHEASAAIQGATRKTRLSDSHASVVDSRLVIDAVSASKADSSAGQKMIKTEGDL